MRTDEVNLRYDVWVMHGNKPARGCIYSFKRSCGIWPSMPDTCKIEVRLRDELCSPFEVMYDASEVFRSKEDLIQSLLNAK